MKPIYIYSLFAGLSIGMTSCVISAAGNNANPRINTKQLSMELRGNTPDQMKAFYEGRGFPQKARERIGNTCYFTVIINNKSNDILWLEPGNWRFMDKTGLRIKRFDHNYWKRYWKTEKLSLANQSTFTWTLLPDSRDLHPNETAGGNIVIEPVDHPFNLEARFKTGKDKRGSEIVLRFDGVKCAKDEVAK